MGSILWLTGAVAGDSLAAQESCSGATDPLGEEERQQLVRDEEQVLRENPPPTEGQRNAEQIHSRRGDAMFFLGRYSEAVDEYRAMVMLRKELDASHWRLGIAYFFAGRTEEAAEQFDRYHTFDQVDRENGIWRFLSHYVAFGAEKAQKQLLRYERDDREPFPAVYRLFDGSLSPEQALALISAELPKEEHEKRLFYTELYIGMLYSVQDQKTLAAETLSRAVSRKWPRNAGYGPAWMWHVARLEHQRVCESLQRDPPDQSSSP